MNTRIYVLKFSKEIAGQPIICRLAKQYDAEFNILQAQVLPQHEGVMVIELKGHETNIKEGLSFLKGLGVEAKRLAAGISRDEERCYQCGACTGICPTGSLSIRRSDMAVLFAPEKCSGCSLCVPVCPARAMQVSLDKNGDLLA